MNNVRRAVSVVALAAALAAAAAPPVPSVLAQGVPGADPARAPASWTPRTVELAALLPVQEGGRVKPLSTFAGFALLRMNGRRTYTTAAGERLTPTHWLLDCLLRPERAVRERVFLVENDGVLDAAGIPHEGRGRRDRYSYEELAPGRSEVFRRAREYDRIEARDRTPVQAQMLRLALNMREFETLIGSLEFARHGYDVSAVPGADAIFEGVARPGLADILARREALREVALRERAGGGGPGGAGGEAVTNLLGTLVEATAEARAPAILPPGPAGDREWMTVHGVVERAFTAPDDVGPALRVIAALESLARAAADPAAAEAAMERLHAELVSQASARGEYARVPLEVRYYRWDFFHRALMAFVAAFLLAGLTWLWPANRWLARGVLGAAAVGFVLVTAGVVVRCVIRGRPPVTTLYETILFVTGVAVGAALFTEYVNRRRVAIAVAAVFGTVGMFLAGKFETHEAVDTMPNLIAVLDTNFWLATHVTTINIGYAAVLFSGAVAHAYILARVFGLRRGDVDFFRSTARMVYGLQAFGLVFSLVGTILGGIWANDSWGRFWGWDPKENGALMICLWGLILLHARLGGYLHDFGFCMGAVFGGMITAFSWWGVNLLGIGLHSYGFTSGAMFGLLVFYGIEGLVMLAGGIHRMVAPGPGTAAAPLPAPAPEPGPGAPPAAAGS